MYKQSTPGFARNLLDTASVAFNGQTVTADEYSESIDIKSYLYVGLALDLGTVGGTSPTLDVKGEISFDGGTSWYNCPQDANTTTQIALSQFTATGEEFKYFAIPSVQGTADGAKFRFFFDVGGTSPSFEITEAKLVMFAGTN